MKKIILSVLMVTVYTCTIAQNTSKNGHQITPETDDWGIAIDVNPLFNFMGNMFNGNMNNSSPTWNFANNSPVPFTITGYMLKDENTAYRGKIRLGIGSSKQTNFVDDDLDTSGVSPTRTREDERKVSGNNILIGAGIQKMRGKHRVKGFYGAEAEIGIMSGKTTYSYGNAMTITNQNPTSTVEASWDDPSYGGPYSSPTSSRTTESKMGGGFYIGIRGFIGVEYFVAPKISIAGEFGWGLGMLSRGEGESKSQYVSTNAAGDPVVISETSKTGKSSTFGLDNDSGAAFSLSSGSIRMCFYF